LTAATGGQDDHAAQRQNQAGRRDGRPGRKTDSPCCA